MLLICQNNLMIQKKNTWSHCQGIITVTATSIITITCSQSPENWSPAPELSNQTQDKHTITSVLWRPVYHSLHWRDSAPRNPDDPSVVLFCCLHSFLDLDSIICLQASSSSFSVCLWTIAFITDRTSHTLCFKSKPHHITNLLSIPWFVTKDRTQQDTSMDPRSSSWMWRLSFTSGVTHRDATAEIPYWVLQGSIPDFATVWSCFVVGKGHMECQ